LRAEQAAATDDQPPVAADGLGDLRLTLLGIVLDGHPGILVDPLHRFANAFCMRTPIEYCHQAVSSRLNTLVFQNPESARSSFTPLARARATRAINSSQNRSVPLRVFDRSLAQPDVQHLPRVRPGGENRVVTEQLGVPVGGALLSCPHTSPTKLSTSITNLPSPGPAPACHARTNASRATDRAGAHAERERP
jgi:hypothetical protein